MIENLTGTVELEFYAPEDATKEQVFAELSKGAWPLEGFTIDDLTFYDEPKPGFFYLRYDIFVRELPTNHAEAADEMLMDDLRDAIKYLKDYDIESVSIYTGLEY